MDARADPGPRLAWGWQARGPALLVLGPLRVEGNGGTASLGGRKPRILLATLALQAGETVSADRLADAIWGEALPRSARQNVHTYIWALRRSLAAAGCRSAISAQPPGYRLDVAPGELDWHRFGELSSAAARRAHTDPAAASDLLGQALGLWRGAVLADIADELPALRARILAMEEARLAALEQRVEADLAAGRHGKLVTVLTELVTAHPFREKFRAQQMLALHRCGRSAEAIAGFHQLRRHLSTELGLDPSPDLGQLYASILRADPHIGQPAAQRKAPDGAAQRKAPDGAAPPAVREGPAGHTPRPCRAPHGLREGLQPDPRDELDTELARQVRAALHDIYRLDRLAASPLTGLAQIPACGHPGVELRNSLLLAVRALRTSASAPDRQAGAVLDEYYLRRSGSIRQIAAKLGLTRTTCQRRLRLGLSRVCEHLRTAQLPALTPVPYLVTRNYIPLVVPGPRMVAGAGSRLGRHPGRLRLGRRPDGPAQLQGPAGAVAVIGMPCGAEGSVPGVTRGEFGALLRRFRLAAALTMEELAELAGLSPRAVWNLECGRTQRPRRSTIEALRQALPLDDGQARLLAAAARPALTWADEGGGTIVPASLRRQEGASPPEPPGALGEAPGAGQARRAQAAGAHTPAQLPHPVPAFAGRAVELARLAGLAARGRAAGGPVFCLIDGLPGVGKTALALRFAHSVAGEYPDGQLYASLRGFHPAGGPRRATTLLSRLLQDLGVAPSLIPAGPEARAAKFRSILAGRRVVMVLDDAASADQVRPLLPGNSACLVLVTSRHRLGGLVARDGAYRVTLGVLGPADAHELLAGAVGADRVSADPSAAATLARQCGYLPLALHILADKIGTHPCVPLADFARELDHEAARLDALTVAGDPAAGVRATIARSYQRLPPSAARLYRLLALYRGPSISVGAAAAVAAAAPAQAGALLAQLTGAHLLEESAPHRYQFHDLLRLYAAERAIAEDPQAERDAALARLSGGAGPGPAGEPPRDQRRYGQGPRSAHCTAELGHAQPGHTQPGHAQQHGARAEGGHGRAARLPHPHATDGPARLASGTPHRKTPWTRSLGRRRRWPGPPARCRWR